VRRLLRRRRQARADERAARGLSTRPRFLVVREATKGAGLYEVVLEWIERRVPGLRGRFELRLLPFRAADLSPYALLVPWLQDPVQAWSWRRYEQALALQRRCDAAGIAVVNRVERLPNAAKREGALRMASVGLRTPRTEPIVDARAFRADAERHRYPLLVREDWGHQAPLHRADAPSDLAAIPIERMARPLAVEFVDVRDPRDGLWRKYRYLAAGDRGTPLHLHATTEWLTRGGHCLYTDETRRAEIAFLEGREPRHALLHRALDALGLDVAAFDYGLTPAGEMVVWEANPYPYLHFGRPTGRGAYRFPATERAIACLVRLYLCRAGLAVPPALEALVPPA
jgi:hypothetical protein